MTWKDRGSVVKDKTDSAEQDPSSVGVRRNK